ncbi:MAG: flagellar motor stator protein MotA [Bdellovibrionales bacterium]|nr:flagellar motor stator protein MotA [Bdellovibrionales bacterium]
MGFFGIIFGVATVMAGYLMHHGKIGILIQPTEVIIIFGAAIGSAFIMAPLSKVLALIKMVIKALTYSGIKKEQYNELLSVMFQLFQTFRKDGPQSIEAHIEKPESSEIFKKSPYLLHHHHALSFMCDTMKITLSADISPFDVDDLLDQDIKSMHEEEHESQHIMQVISEALPGLGIVAAVLGIVITMGKLDQGTETIGMSVAAALVGTFMGVWACYGFIGPIASKIASDLNDESYFFKAIKAALVSNQKGAPPLVCVDAARRVIPPHVRPSFNEMDELTKKK